MKGKISDESLAFLEAEGKQIEILIQYSSQTVPVGERFINSEIDEWGNESKKVVKIIREISKKEKIIKLEKQQTD